MPLLEWRDEYLLGIKALDYEHQDLFDCVNSIYEICLAKADYETLADCLGRLHSRLAAHFALEETTMLELRNPHYQEHKTVHDEFLDEITGAVVAVRDGTATDDINRIARRVQDWIITHITTFDRQLVEREIP